MVKQVVALIPLDALHSSLVYLTLLNLLKKDGRRRYVNQFVALNREDTCLQYL